MKKEINREKDGEIDDNNEDEKDNGIREYNELTEMFSSIFTPADENNKEHKNRGINDERERKNRRINDEQDDSGDN